MTALKQIVCGWLYRIVSTPGRNRWLALAAAAFLFMLSALYLTGGADYREDPSALVPRSADLYAETRDLPELLKTAGAWRLWRTENRGMLERELAALLSARMGGLPVNSPMRWIETSLGAAWSVSRDGAGAESWALYLKLEEPEMALKEIEVEPGMTLETAKGERNGDGVFVLSSQGGGAAATAYLGTVGPWLILSGDAKLPEFALEAKGKPGVSLAGADMLPRWRWATGLRGLFNPSFAAAAALQQNFGAAFAPERLSPEARVAYASSLGKNGGVETNFSVVELSGQAPGTGLWPLVYIAMALLALCNLAVVFAVILAMVGWGGWLKAMAMKEGIAPADGPEKVAPSPAFTEDSAESDAKIESPAHDTKDTL